ncbi:hypothetical protein AB0J01_15015 [Streptomyces sp. NPDC050204]|uniref:hypothetical protein n=1 Tax=Streptomyces sp. NPDC050204 TaxID=3155514 RepID=UPI003419982D
MTQEPSLPNLALDLDALAAAVGEQPDRQAAWRFVRAFARDWSRRPLAEADGYAPPISTRHRPRSACPCPRHCAMPTNCSAAAQT